ncbi:hypothetical protein B0H10DRAFT_2216950 [Mycena sp. CBHHK59/15]|nr:hypothetical protein B0H10DRAFT_2216950 [Mycena sp. CBHHK59/15]
MHRLCVARLPPRRLFATGKPPNPHPEPLPDEFIRLWDDPPPPPERATPPPLDAVIARLAGPPRPQPWSAPPPAPPPRTSRTTLAHAHTLRTLIAAGRTPDALALLRTVPRPPPRLLTHTAVHALLRASDPQRAGALLRALTASPLAPRTRIHARTLATTIRALLRLVPATQYPHDWARTALRPQILVLSGQLVSHPALRTALDIYVAARRLFVRRAAENAAELGRALVAQREWVAAALLVELLVKDYQLLKTLPTLLREAGEGSNDGVAAAARYSESAGPRPGPLPRAALTRRLALLRLEDTRPAIARALAAALTVRMEYVLRVGMGDEVEGQPASRSHPNSADGDSDSDTQQDDRSTNVNANPPPSARKPHSPARAKHHAQTALQALAALGALVDARQLPWGGVGGWIACVGLVNPPSLARLSAYVPAPPVPLSQASSPPTPTPAPVFPPFSPASSPDAPSASTSPSPPFPASPPPSAPTPSPPPTAWRNPPPALLPTRAPGPVPPMRVPARAYLRGVLEAYARALPRTPHFFSLAEPRAGFVGAGWVRRGLVHRRVRVPESEDVLGAREERDNEKQSDDEEPRPRLTHARPADMPVGMYEDAGWEYLGAVEEDEMSTSERKKAVREARRRARQAREREEGAMAGGVYGGEEDEQRWDSDGEEEGDEDGEEGDDAYKEGGVYGKEGDHEMQGRGRERRRGKPRGRELLPPADPAEAADDSLMPPPTMATYEELLRVFLRRAPGGLYAAEGVPSWAEQGDRAELGAQEEQWGERGEQDWGAAMAMAGDATGGAAAAHYHAPRSPNNPDPGAAYPAHPLDFKGAPPPPPLPPPARARAPPPAGEKHRTALARRVLIHMLRERSPPLPPWDSPGLRRLFDRRGRVLAAMGGGLADELARGEAARRREERGRVRAFAEAGGRAYGVSEDGQAYMDAEWEGAAEREGVEGWGVRGERRGGSPYGYGPGPEGRPGGRWKWERYDRTREQRLDTARASTDVDPEERELRVMNRRLGEKTPDLDLEAYYVGR